MEHEPKTTLLFLVEYYIFLLVHCKLRPPHLNASFDPTGLILYIIQVLSNYLSSLALISMSMKTRCPKIKKQVCTVRTWIITYFFGQSALTTRQVSAICCDVSAFHNHALAVFPYSMNQLHLNIYFRPAQSKKCIDFAENKQIWAGVRHIHRTIFPVSFNGCCNKCSLRCDLIFQQLQTKSLKTQMP